MSTPSRRTARRPSGPTPIAHARRRARRLTWHRRAAIAAVALLATAALAPPPTAPAADGPSGTVDVAVAASDDDAEQLSTGYLDLTSSDLELVVEKVGQVVGIRFRGVGIPRAAVIDSAWIQFTVDEVSTRPADLVVWAEDAGDTAAFSAAATVTGRTLTADSIAWVPPPWPTEGAAGTDQQTPDLSALVQRVVDRSDWASGNAITFVLTGTGTRTAESFDGTAAPRLHVAWHTDGGTTTTAPVSTTTTTPATTTTTSVPASTTTSATSTTTTTTSTSTTVAKTTTTVPVSTTTTVPTTTTTVPPGGGSLTTAIASSSDDAEETTTGWLDPVSSDLELVDEKTRQTVGLRYAGVAIPAGATITEAWIQFTVDEVSTGPADIVFRAEDSADAATFTGTRGISSRPTLAPAVGWTAPAWPTVGAAGADQKSPDLRTLIQAVVDRPGWAAGHALAVIITGSGTRTAESSDGDGGPVLHVTWTTGSPTTTTTVPPTTTTTTTTVPATTTTSTSTTTTTGTTTSTSTTTTSTTVPPAGATKIAVIGDYGDGSSREAAVAAMIGAWGPDAIVTAGDNTYSTAGYDRIVGRYYHSYIGGYQGTYGAGSSTNRFFPALGNHDYEDGDFAAYLSFFTLPGPGVTTTATSGNERYYDARIGSVHVFVLNSQPEEPDGITSTSTQGHWLRAALAASTARWNIVVVHNPPYSSVPGKSSLLTRLPFRAWGADLVVSGDAHLYERIHVDGFDYVVSGLGINHATAGTPITGSQVIYTADDAGALFITACADAMRLEYQALAGGIVDSYVIGSGACP